MHPTPLPTSAPAPSLMHRWFVQYNPAYLASAAFVLAGIWILLREAADSGSVAGQLGVAGLAELYAFALIGGAAFLTRIGLRRPAVMLALLAVLYQGDLTLHVETCAFLGVAGKLASAAWLGAFVVKLGLLSWALELRSSGAAKLVPVLGAVGLATLPHVLRELGPEEGTAAVSLWVFVTGAAGLWTARRVTSAVGFDLRGLRSIRATWIVWATLALAHVAYWVAYDEANGAVLIAVLALLATRALQREAAVWGLVAATLGAVALVGPAHLWLIALLCAVTLTLHAYRAPLARFVRPLDAPRPPYRGASTPLPRGTPETFFGRAPDAAVARLVTGAAAAVYLGVWSLGWRGGAWPTHLLLLDVVLVALCLGYAFRRRRLVAIAPTATVLHLLVERGWTPETATQWGAASVALGFVCLVGSLYVSWKLRASVEAVSPAGPEPPPVA